MGITKPPVCVCVGGGSRGPGKEEVKFQAEDDPGSQSPPPRQAHAGPQGYRSEHGPSPQPLWSHLES